MRGLLSFDDQHNIRSCPLDAGYPVAQILRREMGRLPGKKGTGFPAGPKKAWRIEEDDSVVEIGIEEK